MARGLFADQDLTVSLLEPEGGPDNIRRVADGGADVCLTSVNHYLTARNNFGDLPARFVAVVSQRHPIAGLVRTHTPAHVPADLSALRLGGSREDSLTRELLAGLTHLGVPPPTLVDVPYAEAPAALGEGTIDVLADFADLVPRVRRQAGVGIRAIRAGAPVYATGLVAADRLDDEVVAQVRAGLVASLEQHRADPSSAVDEFLRRYPEVSADEALEGWSYAQECIFTGAPVGQMSSSGWRDTLQHVSRTHGWPIPAPESVYRPAFLSDAPASILTGDPA